MAGDREMAIALKASARPPVHFSTLKSMGSSPMHYAHAVSVEREETKALRMGAAVDAMIFSTSPVIDFSGRRAGPEWRAFAEANAGAICLNNAEAEQVRGMVHALEARRDAMDLLEGERQKTIRWKLNGRACEGTPDVFTADRITELKTCRSAHPERFVWDARRRAYPAQLAWYIEGLLRSGRASPSTAYIVAVESIAPHPVTVFVLSARALDQGARTWRLWFERLRACEESNTWPPYAENAVLFDAPEDEGFSLRIGGEEVEID